jgi:hypothetical protein
MGLVLGWLLTFFVKPFTNCSQDPDIFFFESFKMSWLNPLREKISLPCDTLHGKAAQMHGKGFAVRARTANYAPQRVRGKAFIAVRMAKLHGKGLCRACATLPCGRCFVVRTFFAVRRGVWRAWGLFRAASSLLQRGYHACRSAAVSTASVASSELLIDGWIHRLASCAPRVVDWPCASRHTTMHFLLCGWVLISIPFIMLLSLNLCSALRNKKK